MASAVDCAKLGMSPHLARRVGYTISAKTAVGTTLAAAAAITDNLTIVTTDASNTAVKLPSLPAGSGPLVVFCNTATTAVVFPNTATETINNGSAGASVNCVQNGTVKFWKVSSTNWAALTTA